MKRLLLILTVGLVLSGLVTMATAQTTTALSDVASFQATSSSSSYGGSYVSGNAVNGGPYWRFEAGNTDQNAWWKVDLGQAWDVEQLTLQCRMTDLGPQRLNGATLMAFGPDGSTKVADNWVINGFLTAAAGGPVYSINVDNGGAGWNGVRYFQIGGTDPENPSGPALGFPSLTVLEFEAWAQVPVYDTFIQGVTATANNTVAGYPSISPADLVDNSGMSDQSTLLGDPTATHRVISVENFWCTSSMPPVQPVLTFDLGDTYDLDKIVIWGSDQNQWRQTKECLIEVSTDGEAWAALTDTNGEGLGNYTLTANDFSTAYTQRAATDTLNVGGVTASHVRMTLLSLHAPVHPTGDICYGLSEVRFYQTVPEPSALVLLIIGGLCLLRRRS